MHVLYQLIFHRFPVTLEVVVIMTQQLCSKSCNIPDISLRTHVSARNICWSFFMLIFSGKHFGRNNRSTFEFHGLWMHGFLEAVFILSVHDSTFSMQHLMPSWCESCTWDGNPSCDRRQGESMTQKYQSYFSSTSQLNECCFMNVVTEINAQVHSVSLNFPARKANKNGSNANRMERTNNVVGARQGGRKRL